MDNVVKLDQFEYELNDIFNYSERMDIREYSYTIMKITLDGPVDPVIGDIFNEIKLNPHVHVDGRYFICKHIEVFEHADVTKMFNDFYIELILYEEFRKGEAVNEIR